MPAPSRYVECTSLPQVMALLQSLGAQRIYAKSLAPNDNSKNQVYLGGDLGVANLLPSSEPIPSKGSRDQPIFKATVQLYWVSALGTSSYCPEAKLILYPQYPEVRLSGFLRGSSLAPSYLMNEEARIAERLLFFGVRQDGHVLAHVVTPDSPVAKELRALRGLPTHGVLWELPPGPTPDTTSRTMLLAELCRIASAGWIDSKRLDASGSVVTCEAENCGGYTLEAELRIVPNSFSEPDYLGWEVKQHGVGDLASPSHGPVTLMTPEPTGGVYRKDGVEVFLKRFGYLDPHRRDRINFSGVHRVGVPCARTGCTLELEGFLDGVLVDANGHAALIGPRGQLAATWSFGALLSIWKRKHAQAVFVPSMTRHSPMRQYTYGSRVRLGIDTDFLRFLAALADGDVYYDPGIKLERIGRRSVTKRRSQFRVKATRLARLYSRFEEVDACSGRQSPVGG